MIDDIKPPQRLQRKSPKRIEPIAKPAAAPLHEQAKAADPTFQTPDEIAKLEPAPIQPKITEHTPEKKKHWWSGPYGRKQQVFASVLLIVFAVGIGAGWAHTHKRPTAEAVTPKPTTAKKEAPKPVIYSTLSGLPVADDSVNQRPVTGVMIENSMDARPQSGLDQASVVFEAIAEGGITRFMGVYQDTEPDYLGPVRSVRPYYIEWGLGFDAAIAHVGGSPEALQDMKTWKVKDLDQFANGGAYERISSRPAPHNVYTSMDRLRAIETKKGYGASPYTGFQRKTEQPYKAPAAAGSSASTKAPTDTRATATSIDFGISSALYNAHYDYDATTNTYKRSEGGAPHYALHKDGAKVQLAPKVAIAMVMQYGIQNDGKHSDYNVIGSGVAYFFQDGTVTQGKWTKNADREQISFTDAAGAAFKLNPGQTWITAVNATNKVSYK